MPDIFDEVESAPSTDIFDEVEYSDSTPDTTRERRRVTILGEMAALERERAGSDRVDELLSWGDRPLSPRDIAGGLVRSSPLVAVPGMRRLADSVPDVSMAEAVNAALAVGSQLPPGVRASVADAAAGMATPQNVALAVAGGGASAIPRMGGAVARGVAGGFGADMARHLPEQATALGEAYGAATTPEEKQKILSDLALGIVMPAAALAGAVPPIGRATPPRIPGVLSAEEAAANRAAVNLSAPGTVRPTEIQRIGPVELELMPPEFQLGSVPFDAARRFGTTKLPPVEVLPQSGRLPPVQILDEPRSLLERETRGKASFGAEAPTLTREALPIPPEVTAAAEQARAVGLPRAAAAAEEAARGENRMAPYRPPRELTAERVAQQERKAARQSVEEGLTMPEIPPEPLAPDVAQFPEAPGMPGGTLSRLQSDRIQAGKTVRTNQRNNPPSAPEVGKQSTIPAEGFKSMEDAFEAGYNRRSPEGVAELEAFKAANDTAKAAARAAKDLDTFANLAQKGSKIDEALSIARGEVADRKIAREWLAARELQDLPANAGTGKAYELGKSITTPEALADTWARVKAEETRATELLESATDDAAITAASEVGTRAGLLKESIEASHGMGAGMKFDKTKITQAEYDARMASQKPLGEAPTPSVPQGTPGGLEAKLEKLKFSQEMGGELRTNLLKDIPVAVWNGAIDAAILAVKAGRTLADGVELAISQIRKQVSNFDEQRARDYFKTILAEETKPSAGAAAKAGSTPKAAPGAPTPPAGGTGTPPPGATPPGAPPPGPGAAPGRVSLDDIYKRFELDPKPGTPLKERATKAVEAFRTGMSSKFRPLNKLAEDIADAYGTGKKDVAAVFEQLKGSSGKAEADVYRFDQEVSKGVKGLERDFNAYMMLQRSIDRLTQDMATGETRRAVAGYTLPEMQAKLAELERQVGPDKFAKLQAAGDTFQKHLDQALQLQVTSGRMPLEVYEAIKDGNQFYAPFKIARYFEDTMRPPGTGKTIDTVADLTKAMVGVEDAGFKLGDMLAAGRQSIALSRILAEKNLAMQEITQLARLDASELFIQKLASGADAPKGMEKVKVLENGKQVDYAVDESVAQALHTFGPQAGPLIARMAAGTFKVGATTFNIPFQPVNLLFADIPRAALVSKYGIKGVRDLVQLPMDYVDAIFSSISGNVFGRKNKLYLDFLDSGAAGTTIQNYLTPDALEFKPTRGSADMVKSTLMSPAHFANAIEQASKIVGIKRAMREHGAATGAELAINVPEAITEVRRFSGSPDFGRSGKWVDQAQLNLLLMFYNARVQGTVADFGRLLGRGGAGTAAKTWAKAGIPAATATALLYWYNNLPENKEDFAKRPENERRNYWLIPKSEDGQPRYIKGLNGEKIRDYWRIPKREIGKWVGNTVESGMTFAEKKDPQALMDWGSTMMEDASPINIQGENMTERMESVASGLNPLLKAPLEMATGRDTFRHKDIVPDSMKKADPEEQYTDRTSAVFKGLAEAMPDVAPEAFRSPLMLENMTKNFTAGLFTQFLPRKPVEGRSAAENNPLLQRFQAVPYEDTSEFDRQIKSLERESANDQLARFRTAKEIVESGKGKSPHELVKTVVEKHGRDAKLAEKVIELWTAEKNGITAQERRLLALPTVQRAEYLADLFKDKDGTVKAAMIQDMARKRILTEAVAAELIKLSPSALQRSPEPSPRK